MKAMEGNKVQLDLQIAKEKQSIVSLHKTHEALKKALADRSAEVEAVKRSFADLQKSAQKQLEDVTKRGQRQVVDADEACNTRVLSIEKLCKKQMAQVESNSRDELAHIKTLMTALQKKLSRSEEVTMSHQKELYVMQQGLSHEALKLADATSSLTACKTALTTCQATLTHSEAANSELAASIDHHNEAPALLEVCRKEVAELQKQLEHAETIAVQLENHKIQLRAAQAEVTAALLARTQADDAATTHKKALGVSLAALAAANEVVAKERYQMLLVTDKSDSLQAALEKSTVQVERLRKSADVEKSSHYALTTSNEQLVQERLDALNKALELSRRDLEGASEQTARLQRKLLAVQAELASKEAALVKSRGDVEREQSECYLASNEAARLNSLLVDQQSLVAVQEDASTGLQALQDTLASCKTDLVNLQGLVSVRTQQLETERKDKNSLSDACAAAKAQVEELKAELAAAVAEPHILRSSPTKAQRSSAPPPRPIAATSKEEVEEKEVTVEEARSKNEELSNLLQISVAHNLALHVQVEETKALLHAARGELEESCSRLLFVGNEAREAMQQEVARWGTEITTFRAALDQALAHQRKQEVQLAATLLQLTDSRALLSKSRQAEQIAASSLAAHMSGALPASPMLYTALHLPPLPTMQHPSPALMPITHHYSGRDQGRVSSIDDSLVIPYSSNAQPQQPQQPQQLQQQVRSSASPPLNAGMPAMYQHQHMQQQQTQYHNHHHLQQQQQQQGAEGYTPRARSAADLLSSRLHERQEALKGHLANQKERMQQALHPSLPSQRGNT